VSEERPTVPELRDCPECGEELPPRAAFCPHCGQPLTPAARRAAESRLQVHAGAGGGAGSGAGRPGPVGKQGGGGDPYVAAIAQAGDVLADRLSRAGAALRRLVGRAVRRAPDSRTGGPG
jgi:hypothetical protein